ncbi:E3 ubiquitin ligase BIG BROTHER isoform X1 [Prunus yedoensis var. nudiflora]|uniref:E3 ubiquitin ligase BIG BROTHER isoform X1 n=1 Tax=Prunus yedoensis var. nudiflora TaxID=2094558 RepID=A0A314XWA5_PRUYE|nr:E3 ubiquitin ligase BIG BROTHER isoform X1 [Prunus yedoensis var. nudiflora]
MNGNGQMDVHYIDTDFPYTPTESFMDFFGGVTHVPMDYGHALPMHDQETAYWSMNMHSYKFGPSGQGSNSYYEEEDAVAEAVPEECIQNQQNTNTSQVVWQEDIDPDNMTYEELLDLGEAVGTQSRGLSDELISLLPTSKYKCGSFFSRKKSGERCVICQMRYKRGDRQINLPCKHVYHSECISKWLGINKVCPVCNLEVSDEESRR